MFFYPAPPFEAESWSEASEQARRSKAFPSFEARSCRASAQASASESESESEVLRTCSTLCFLSFSTFQVELTPSLFLSLSFLSAASNNKSKDTIRTVEGYCDCIVLRHFQAGSARAAASVSAVPLLNAGDGPGQHPTQALLDVYTIRRELGPPALDKDGVRVALVGDLANGRTARSLAYLLASNYPKVSFVFVAPPVVRMGDDIKQFLDERGVPWTESSDLRQVASQVDVLYQTRIQKERFKDKPQDYEAAKGKFIVNAEVMQALPKTSIVMHPLPRVDEIVAAEVDADPRAAYFRQAKNGLFVRMALLKLALLR